MSSVATAAWVDVPYAVDHRAASYFRGGFNSCAVRGDSLYVFGDLETLHEFNFEKKIWRVVPWNGDAPKPRQGYAGFHYGDCFYVFGGLTNGSIERDFIQYDFATRTWSVVVVNTGIQPAVICSFATVLHASSMYSLQQGQAQSVELHKFEFLEDTEVFGHKNLCMRYESFKALIQAEEQGSHSPRIEITDMSRATFLLVLGFEIESLKQLCANKVRNSITVETAADIFKLADQHRAVELQNECAAMIMANFEVVSKSQAFQDLLLNNSSLVLKMLKPN
ncbi:hypothetical protein PR003_g3840 [Phytophthora rubi]|uniref:BTB domain-containing protein n=1 Tax=Phytophthora rubi TaxID=129364 RepID=A0A6A4G624_9STRA|nr:hypothetical protein PR003_g3840 [Phytophthora rubi]